MKHSISYHDVPRETFSKVWKFIEAYRPSLDLYIDRLLWWNQRLNLVSRDVSRETLQKHVFHSVIISTFSPFIEASFIVDAGSGGGLPGIPLAICNPEKNLIINDIVSKKVLAVKQITRDLGLQNVRFHDRSIERLSEDKEFLLLTKHAFKISDLYHMCKDKPWNHLIFLKGISFKEELESINEPLSISTWDLSENSEDDFFEGKAIVIVSRK